MVARARRARAAPTSVVAEADGGSRGNPGNAAYGAVLKDRATGEVIAERGERIGVATNNVAEYRGLIAALELYRDHAEGAELEVLMDSKLVVEQMSGRWKIKHPDMRPLASRARDLAPAGTTYTWIPRERNQHADRLANEALDGPLGVVVGHRPTPAGAADARRRRGRHARGGRARRGDRPRPRRAGAHARRGSRARRRCWCSSATARPTTPTPGCSAAPPGATRSSTPSDARTSPRPRAGWRRCSRRRPRSSPRRCAGPARPRRCSSRRSRASSATRPRIEAVVDDGLVEAGFGEWEGLTYTEVLERDAELFTAWLGRPRRACRHDGRLHERDGRADAGRARPAAERPPRQRRRRGHPPDADQDAGDATCSGCRWSRCSRPRSRRRR